MTKQLDHSKENIVDYLLRNGLANMPLSVISSKLSHVAKEFISLNNSLRNKNIKGYLLQLPVPRKTTIDNRWLPDFVWSIFCEHNSSLSHYPIGDILERSVKQTVTSLYFMERDDTCWRSRSVTAFNLTLVSEYIA
jgi:hypothetical protein